jgi:four helix bundle protein
MENGKNTILTKSFSLAKSVIILSRKLQGEKKEYDISRQLLRSATAIGAMVREAQQGESKADFIHKLAIALKEAKESEYWIELLIATEILNKKEVYEVSTLLNECISMLTAIIKTSRSRIIR